MGKQEFLSLDDDSIEVFQGDYRTLFGKTVYVKLYNRYIEGVMKNYIEDTGYIGVRVDDGLMVARELYVKKKGQPKFIRGEPIRNLDEMVKQEFVFWNDKVTHRGWFLNWNIHMALDAMEIGRICYAIRNDDGAEPSVKKGDL